MITEVSSKLYGGLDLHANNVYCAIKDQDGKPVFNKRLPTEMSVILKELNPFCDQLEAIAVESTYNWYWLVDGLAEAGFPVRLANPAAMEQYSGLKQTDDQSDAFWLAEMLRLGVLPEGYIYPKEIRPLRDMLRRRLLIVRQRTQMLLSLQSMVIRMTSKHVSGAKLKKWNLGDVQECFSDSLSVETAWTMLQLIHIQDALEKSLEKQVRERAKIELPFNDVLGISGIGYALGLTILLETGPISRFKSAGNYASYCRMVKSHRASNGKKKGENNRKNGNKYLCWAFVEAANYAQRYHPDIQRWFERKRARTMRVVATKALGCKLAKATFYVLRDEVPFDQSKLF